MPEKTYIVQCCKCAKLRIGGQWIDAQSYLAKDLPRSHGYCPSCLAEEIEKVETWIARETHTVIPETSLATTTSTAA
jgi:hypothetical protein